jgi:Concanavalin A-like lectin/glucanases superfamily
MKTSPTHSLIRSALVLPAILAALAMRADYPSTILTDSPDAYYRLNDSTVRTAININSGSLGAAANATNDLPTGVVRSVPGAIAGDSNRASFFDFTTRTSVPFNAALNRPANQPFTVEAWFLPSSDQSGNGMSPVANRWTQGGPRQGWVMFQRRPSADNTSSESGLGWNFRMYSGVDTSTALDVQSAVPFTLGKWQHVVIVYDPVGDAAVGSTLKMYIDGVLANTATWENDSKPGYGPCTDDHDPSEAVNGQPGLALGNYNNGNGNAEDRGAVNPWFGGIDEFAYYPAKLSDAQILAHYQNGTNSSRTTPYATLIQADAPSLYLRLGEIAPGSEGIVNAGDTRAAGNGTASPEVRYSAPGALVGRPEDRSMVFHSRNGNSPISIPFSEANNPNAGVPFTLEAWLRPTRDLQGGQAPIANRMVGGSGRTGWVIFQRNPNESYPASEGLGWNFRMFTGNGNSGQDVVTKVPYVVGRWQHLVVTWEPQVDNGDPGGNGNHQFQGILTAYVDGVQVDRNENALYAANRAVPEDGQGTPPGTPSDIGIGGYNIASGLGNNPYEGGVDELAIYNNYVLKPEQILAHYQSGTNARPDVNYETLVYTAAFDVANSPDQTRERVTLPASYFRFNEASPAPVTNSGTVGALADGSVVNGVNDAAGPVGPGIAAGNNAVTIGARNFVSLNNPAPLDITGQITLEAWIKPEASQETVARIVSHGPAIPSDFNAADLGITLEGSLLLPNEVSLRIEGGTEYVVGSVDETGFHGTRAPVGSDLGSGQWVHLVGTYDGSTWRLFRNGVQIGSTADSKGAVSSPDGDWAIGSTGSGWAENFAGGIDEVAIYRRSLSAAQVKAHFDAATSAAISDLGFARTATGLRLTWTGGTLQSSDTFNSGFSDVAGASSPLEVPASTGSKYYRLRQ